MIFVAGLFLLWCLGAYLPTEVNVEDATMAGLVITVVTVFAGAFLSTFMEKEPSY